MQVAPLSPPDVERALAEVYARPEFVAPVQSPIGGWLREAIARVGEWLSRVLSGIGITPDGLSILGWVAAAVFVVLALAALMHIAGSGAAWWQLKEWPRRTPPPPAPPAARTAADWQARARELAAAGRWREAVLALYQSLLLGLDARGSIRYDAAKTPGDYRRELRRADPALSRTFDAFVGTFEPAAFGSRQADAVVFARLQTIAQEAGAHA